MRIWKMVGAAVIVLLFIYILYSEARRCVPAPPYGAGTDRIRCPPNPLRANGLDQTGISDVEWQEQPITVVPNDYQE